MITVVGTTMATSICSGMGIVLVGAFWAGVSAILAAKQFGSL